MKKAILMTAAFLFVLWGSMAVFQIFEPTMVGEITAAQAKDTIGANVNFRLFQMVPRIIYTIFALSISYVWIRYIVNLTKENTQKTK